MKLLLLSDAHCRYLAPENRIDKDFFNDVVLRKLKAVVDIANEQDVDALLQAGDLFDSSDPTRYVCAEVIKVLKRSNAPIYTVLGQHDVAFRALEDITRTGAYLLESTGVIQIVGLNKKPVYAPVGMMISGLSFEQDYDPQPVEKSDTVNFNILVAHATVGEKPLYPGDESESVRRFIKKHKNFDLVLLGDVHTEFQDDFLGTQVFNTGPLIRKSIAEKLQKPNVIIYDTETRKYERIEVPHKPWREVFNLQEEKKEADSKLEEFIQAIKNEKKQTVSFEDNLVKYYEQHKVSEDAKKVIASAMEKSKMSQKELKEIV